MSPEEKSLIDGVFDRLARGGVGHKDPAADALIQARAQTLPDATYGLVQAVVMLEAGLSQAQARIAALEQQIAATKVAATGAPGFLPQAGPWAQAAAQAAPAPVMAPQPVYAASPQGGWVASGSSPGSTGGGFLRNAATLAAGIAGGSLIAEGLSSLFGHGYGGYGGGFGGGFAGSPWGAGMAEPIVENVTVNNVYEDGGGSAAAPDGNSASDVVDDNGAYDDAGTDFGGDNWSDDGSI